MGDFCTSFPDKIPQIKVYWVDLKEACANHDNNYKKIYGLLPTRLNRDRRKLYDFMLFNDVKNAGLYLPIAKLMYFGVRLFGWFRLWGNKEN